MEFHEFYQEYRIARARLHAGEISDLAAEQDRLRALLSSLSNDHDRGVGESLIAEIAQTDPPRPPPSPEMLAAIELMEAAADAKGTTAEQLAVLADTRKKVWAIADRAGDDSAAIRYLTRRLDHQEESLEEPFPWPDPAPDDPPNR